MKIEIEKYCIHLSEETDSTDSQLKFDHYFRSNDNFKPSTQISIKIYDEEVLISSALICSNGGRSGLHKSSQVVTEEFIAICCSDHIFNLSIPSLALNWKTKVDEATCFEIFDLGQDFIVHGELEISRLSKDGKIVWQRSGADIFTTIDAKDEDFRLTDQYIFATDWEHRKYRFDFDGNEIKEN